MGGALSRARGRVRRRGPLPLAGVVLLAAALMAFSAGLAALAEPAEAAFPGKNGRIAYAQYQRPAAPDDLYMSFDVWTANPDGSDARKVDTGESWSAQDPAYSADGLKIAFVDAAHAPPGVSGPDTWQIFVVEVDERGTAVGEPVQVTEDADGSGDDAINPSFSPDGGRIAYTGREQGKEGAEGVYTVRSDGVGERTLVDGGSRERTASDPSWSPDDEKIAYAASDSGSGGDVYTINVGASSGAPEGAPIRITDDGGSDPDWSPDGQRIAYSGWDPSYGSEIFVVDSTPGSTPRQVTNDTDRTALNWRPSFSPDGEEIAYENGAQVYIDLDSRAEVYRIDADAEKGTGTTVTAPGAEVAGRPSWGPVPPPDTAPPTVESTAPEEGAEDIPASGDVSVTFSEPMDRDTVAAPGAFVLTRRGSSTPVEAAVSCEGDPCRTAKLDPNSDLVQAGTYTATLKGGVGGVKDKAGNALVADESWSFTATDTTAPEVSLTAPAEGAFVRGASVTLLATASDKEVGIEKVEFLVDGEVVATHPSTDATAGGEDAGTYSTTWNSSTVDDGTHFIEAKAHDTSGNTASSSRTVTVDNTAPTVVETNPAADAKKVPLTLSATGVTVVFSEEMDEGVLDVVKLERIVKKGKKKGRKIVPVALDEVSLAQDGKTLTIKPKAPGFAKKGAYRATVTVGAKDQAGNALARQESWEFAMAKA